MHKITFLIGKISFEMEYIHNTKEFDTSSPNDLPFFPNKIPLKLNNCQIIVSTGIWPPTAINVNSNEPGIEIDLILALVKHMNGFITFVVDSESWHGLTQDEHGEHTGRLALLKRETFDLMVGGMPTHANIFRDFDTSECFLPNSIAFIVPTAAIFPSSMILWTMLEVRWEL